MDRHFIDELVDKLGRLRRDFDAAAPDPTLLADLIRELGRLRDRLRARASGVEASNLDQGDFLAGILAHSPDVISILDREGRFLFLSRAAPGRDPSALVGSDSRNFLAEEHRQLWHDTIERTVKSALPQHVVLHSVGRYWWDSRIVPIKRGDRVTWLLAIARDISAQKHAEAALEVKEQQLALALEASRMGLWTWNVPEDQVTWDAAAKRIFDWPEDSDNIRYEDFQKRVHPSDRERVDRTVAAAIESGEYPDLTCRIVLPDGSTRWILAKGKVIKNAAGKTVSLVGGVVDVSYGKQTEAQHQRSQKLEAIGQLAGGVAHDFNNLLVAILGNAELAKRRQSDADRAVLLDDLIAAGNRAAALTRQLLVFSRRQPLDETVLEMNSLLADTVKLLSRLLPENIHLEVEPASNVPPVLGDRGQLEQLIVNLCVNARDAMPGGGKLVLKTGRFVLGADAKERAPWARPGTYAFVEVTDSGSGIGPEVLEHIFEPFFTTKAEGTGLGLATAYGVSKRHRGFISVESELGVGTRFRIHLPESQSTPVEDDAIEPVSVEGGRETILLAEDEEPVRAVVTRILERAGYRVIPAEDGARAVELYRQHAADIDLVLLDAVMPRKSGIEALQEILDASAAVAAVLCSGYSEAPNRLSEFSQEVAFVPKPYEPDTLLSVVRQRLDETAPAREAGAAGSTASPSGKR